MTPDNSDCSNSYGNCGTIAAIPYFITYILIVSIILLNLFTAVIIETFEATHNQEDWKLSPQALEQFVTLWWVKDDVYAGMYRGRWEDLLFG